MDQLSEKIIAKHDNLLKILADLDSCAVAFSGGLDSTVLAKAARLALQDKAIAVIGLSPSLAAVELEAAQALAQLIGIRLETVDVDEMSVADYRANRGDRCYHCKSQLFTRIRELANRLGVANIVDGANADDQHDYRPGIQAAREKNARSPLAECGFTKSELRELARYWQLPIWDKPATPCLASRIAYGEQITTERLTMIEQAERFLRERGFNTFRVRYHAGDLARIEVPVEQLPLLIDEKLRRETISYLKTLGFKYITLDLEGFRSGSLNALL